MAIWISIAITLALILANGYFSAAELAMVSVRKTKLEAALDDGDKRARKALDVAADADNLLATIQVYITLLGFFASAAAATTLSDPFASWMQELGVHAGVALPLATVIITLIVSYITIVVGELFPKRLGLANPEGVSMAMASSFAFFQHLARPLVAMTAASSNALARLFHVKSVDERQAVSEDEIKYIVKDNEELLPDEKRMIHEILDLADATARDIMTPRADIIFVEDTETVKETLNRMRGTGYSRLPVYHEDYDRIVGVVKYKDLIPAIMDDREDATVDEFTDEVYFVPETKDIFPLLSEMQTNRQQIAIVVDEYGGTDGLITIEDIVEEIVGEIIDETDLESRYVTQLTDGEWLVDGSLPVDDAIELSWPLEESDDYETIAGWLIDMVDTIPQIGDSYDFGGYRFTVQSMRRRRISVIRVQKLAESTDDTDQSSDSPNEEK
ncbi:hemolysin family protein [Cryptobacterium curtum]|uniref:hemolysin family protein n=1 Tax=Cryptobacterium curtum TaxID=84163 RepID=UPI0023571FA2|nr:hemolysin family protein [Cryptobacterium curtum]